MNKLEPGEVVVERTTTETSVRVALGAGPADGAAPQVALAVPMAGHLLTACFTTWGWPAAARGSGDVDVDPHHLVEDVGLVLGQAIRARWPGYREVARYGWAVVVMDDAEAHVALDLSGRAGCWLHNVPDGSVGGVEGEVLEEFWQALARGGHITVHLKITAGRNRHHQWEAAFKALGLALRMATQHRAGTLSTKGVIGDGGRDCGLGIG
jgi:imidazoleglycerol-phosphate dehydratase